MNSIMKELLNYQRHNVVNDKFLKYNDIKRISKYLDKSIFDEYECTLWKGYVTNINNEHKSTYVNFYINKKKIPLHRLLYVNYVDDIDDDEYIKYTCVNKGICCNINHLKKFKYKKKNKNKNIKNKNIKNKNIENTNKKKSKIFDVDFD